MIHHESLEQQALFEWAMLNESKYPELKLLYHCPNGGKRNAREAARLKKEGVKSGVPDVFLPVAKKILNISMPLWYGLYIELKAGKNETTESQDWWIENLRGQGYRVEVCYGWEAAKNLILDYLT